MPQKDLRYAKSRLALDTDRRQLLVRAMLRDTVSAALACPLVATVVLVVDRPRDAVPIQDLNLTVHVDTGNPGLNAAIRAGAAVARRLRPDAHIAVVPSDLPGLNPDLMEVALRAAGRCRRAFLRDAEGCGTTLLTATNGAPLAPAYGPASAGKHERSGAVDLGPLLLGCDLTTIQTDVDDIPGLKVLSRVGVGDRTKRVLAGIPLEGRALVEVP